MNTNGMSISHAEEMVDHVSSVLAGIVGILAELFSADGHTRLCPQQKLHGSNQRINTLRQELITLYTLSWVGLFMDLTKYFEEGVSVVCPEISTIRPIDDKQTLLEGSQVIAEKSHVKAI